MKNNLKSNTCNLFCITVFFSYHCNIIFSYNNIFRLFFFYFSLQRSANDQSLHIIHLLPSFWGTNSDLSTRERLVSWRFARGTNLNAYIRWGHNSFIFFHSSNTYLIWNQPFWGRKYQYNKSRQVLVFYRPMFPTTKTLPANGNLHVSTTDVAWDQILPRQVDLGTHRHFK